MSYSTVVDKPIKVARRTEHPTVDGESVIQELGYMETKVIRYFWIRTEEVQAEIERLEAEAVDGWVISGEVSRTPISEPLDLYNVTIAMRRLVAS